MRKDKGILVVVSGFSGAGKGTLMKQLLKTYDNYALSVSMTTRKPRVGEEDGREYFFVSTETFEEKIAQGELVEYARYCDNYYGTPRAFVEKQLENGKDVILEIEVGGAMKIREKCPEAVFVFILPPSLTELERRLHKRGTETEEVVQNRVAQAEREIRCAESYDYVVVNGALEDAVQDLDAIIRAESCKTKKNQYKIDEVLGK